MKNRTLLVDSSYLLKKAFNGVNNAYTSEFGHIGGLYGFFTILRKLIKENKINKVVLVWDGEGGGIYRHNIDNAYKANRKSKEWHKRIELSEAEIRRETEKDESILKQRVRIKSYAEELFIRQIEVEKIEADDLIAEYCIRHHKDEEIFLYTNDRDFLQLLEYDITLLLGNIDQPITKRNFFMKFGYHYANALPIKIICGDSADNIEGIKGMGDKTLFKYFPEMKVKPITVREICTKAEQINNERISNKKKPIAAFVNLLTNIKKLKTNYKLTCLKNPMLNESAMDELEILELPLSPENRGSKNLYKYMVEDGFLSQYGGDFASYVQPFFTVIMSEKSRLDEFYKK